MPRPSSITRLDPQIRAEIDRLIRAGRYTLDEIVTHLRALGADTSRSSVGRYRKNAEEQMARYREAQAIAKTWIGKLNEDPNGDVGRLLTEMIRTLAFQTVDQLAGTEQIKPASVMLLSKALKDLASADKITVERAARIREQALKEAAEAVSHAVRKGGLTDETAAAIRAQILGMKS